MAKLIDIQDCIERLESETIFKKWKAKNSSCYFSYALTIIDKDRDNNIWQIGFYNPSSDKITTFAVDKDISMQEEEEVFKEPEHDVEEIKPASIKLPVNGILEKAANFIRENYKSEKIVKSIVHLQNHHDYGTIWNLSYVSERLNVINLKIDAASGDIISDNVTAMFNFVAGKN